MPQFYCVHCGQHIDADESFASTTVRCPTCGKFIVVPSAANIVDPVTSEISLADAHVANSALAPQSKGKAFFTSRAFKASTIAWVICAVFAIFRPQSAWEEFRASSFNVTVKITESFVYLAFAAVPAFLIALVLAIGMKFRSPFGDSLSRGYSVGVVFIALLALAGALILGNDRIRGGSAQPSYAEIKSAQRFAVDLESDVKKIGAEMVAQNGLPKTTNLHFDNTTPATSELEKAHQLMRSFFNDMIKLQNDYLAALDKAEVGKLLVPNRVANDTDFRESYEILAKIKHVVYEFKGRADELFSDFPKRIDNFAINDQTKRSMRDGYQKGFEKALPLFRETWEIEVSSVDLMGQLIEHLEATRKLWVDKNGQFTFQRSADVQRFNQIMDKLNAGVGRQTEIREKALKGVIEKAANLKGSLPK